MPDTTTGVDANGPFFEDLAAGWRFSGSSGHTIDEGHAAWYTAVSGDQAPLFLDRSLAREVTSADQRLIDPALVAQVSIGQSTVATRQVVANLFYRRMVQHPAGGSTASRARGRRGPLASAARTRCGSP